MKWFVLVCAVLVANDAQANIFKKLVRTFGVVDYDSPAEVKGEHHGSCRDQVRVFHDQPQRTYKWISDAGSAPMGYVDSLKDDPKCARNMTKQIAFLIAHYGKNNAAKNTLRHQRAMAVLAALTNQIDGNDKNLQETNCIAIQPRTPIEDIIEEAAPALRRSSDCAPISRSKIKVVSGQQNRVVNAYGIRLNSKGYDIFLNLKFDPMPPELRNAADRSKPVTTPDQMRARVTACLQEASPAMKGPNGKMLAVKLLDDTEISALPREQRPPEYRIRIIPNNFRGDAASYVENASCAFIVHETLHLMGLCDEYKEHDPQRAGICRAHIEAETIMSNHVKIYADASHRQLQCECNETCQLAKSRPESWKFYTSAGIKDIQSMVGASLCADSKSETEITAEQAFSKPKVSLANSTGPVKIIQTFAGVRQGRLAYYQNEQTCSCYPGISNCQAKLEQLKVLAARPEKITNQLCPYNLLAEKTITSAPAQKISDVVGNSFSLYSPPKRDALLAPAHFDRIVSGLCSTPQTTKYRRCAEWAYKLMPSDEVCNKTTAESCITARANENCSGRPAACNDATHFLGL